MMDMLRIRSGGNWVMSTASLLDVPTFNLAMATVDEDELLACRNV